MQFSMKGQEKGDLFIEVTAWAGLNVLVFSFIEDGELKRTLQSLACGKARVVTKEPKVWIRSSPN